LQFFKSNAEIDVGFVDL